MFKRSKKERMQKDLLKEANKFFTEEEEDIGGDDIDEVREHIIDMSKYMLFSEFGGEIDLLDWNKARDELIKLVADNADMTEEEFEEKYLDEDGELKDELEDDGGDNTYNRSFLAPDWNFKFYNNNNTGEYFILAEPHMGGDIRGSYGNGYVFTGEDKEEAVMKVMEGFSGFINVNISFDDDSSINFYGQQDSDIPYYEVGEMNEPKDIHSKEVKQMALDLDGGGEPKEEPVRVVDRTWADKVKEHFESLDKQSDKDDYVDTLIEHGLIK